MVVNLEAANEAAHLVVITHEENFQGGWIGTEQKPDIQACPAFKDIAS